jgi:hypothetical protein
MEGSSFRDLPAGAPAGHLRIYYPVKGTGKDGGVLASAAPAPVQRGVSPLVPPARRHRSATAQLLPDAGFSASPDRTVCIESAVVTAFFTAS